MGLCLWWVSCDDDDRLRRKIRFAFCVHYGRLEDVIFFYNPLLKVWLTLEDWVFYQCCRIGKKIRILYNKFNSIMS